MKEWATDLLDAALFKTAAYERVAGRRDAFYLGFLTIVTIALISAIPAFIGDLVSAARPDALNVNSAAVMADIQRRLDTFAPMLGTTPSETRQMLDQIEQGIELGMDSARQIAAIPTPLPSPIGAILQAIGSYVSRPFTDTGFPLSRVALSTWLGYGIWVMLFAKLMGGRAGLVSFFGATALYAGPFILTLFSFLPILGPLLAIVAFVWGWLIYIKSTKVSHDFGYGKGIVAALLPLLIGAVLVALFAGGIGSLIAMSSMGD
jgi:hypothetical protein